MYLIAESTCCYSFLSGPPWYPEEVSNSRPGGKEQNRQLHLLPHPCLLKPLQLAMDILTLNSEPRYSDICQHTSLGVAGLGKEALNPSH